MIINVARVERFLNRSVEFITSSTGIVCRFGNHRAFYTMTDSQVDGASSLPLLTEEFLFQQPIAVSRDKESSSATPDIEKKYVHHVYDAIAPHFSSTRFAKWPKVATFLNSLPPGSLILDAGCGNGKYLGLNPNCLFIGCDISAPLINICAGRGHEVMVADAVNLPYRTGFGDAAISIAVLHHLSTESRRKKAIAELVRVVRKDGMVLITVWAVEQEDRSLVTKWTPLNQKYTEEWIGPGSPRVRSSSNLTLQSIPETEENGVRDHSRDTKQLSEETTRGTTHLSLKKDTSSVSPRNGKNLENQQEYFVPWHLPYHRAEVSGASACALANGLAEKDDKKGAVVYNRYYHVFIEGELERLVSGIDNIVIVDQFYDKSNWCIILKKT
ncbi:tRNA (carboxymethyluridine(34)-5-O)-methyltransferase-like [Macadamia integrifolia]|uniref:tRNA (carboxymethyluridine(34)-5-O)-methyltransferase-like n=1 Tax=Macadamia integrifolia TaxID=60698 RepID=UPI001C4E3E67|nr:tRNA (carboxymethyluridine(34)-5-O)-methyltransferase-like [Macadamia integrifolia]